MLKTREEVLEERGIVPLTWSSNQSFNEEPFLSAWKRETNDLFKKRAISENALERPHDVTRILSSFKSLIKQINQEGYAQQFNIKKDQNI